MPPFSPPPGVDGTIGTRLIGTKSKRFAFCAEWKKRNIRNPRPIVPRHRIAASRQRIRTRPGRRTLRPVHGLEVTSWPEIGGGRMERERGSDARVGGCRPTVDGTTLRALALRWQGAVVARYEQDG